MPVLKWIYLVLSGAVLWLATLANAAISVSTGTASNQYVLSGRIATPDETIDGKVIISGDTITCVGPDCADPANATRITVSEAYILPGFIDAHNHVAYNVFPKWTPPKLYQSRYQWEGSTSYKTFKAPYNALKASLFCEMVKYGEVKALLSGVTTIQGTSPDKVCFRTLIRNAENENQLGVGADLIRTSILDIKTFKDTVDWTKTQAFVVHLGEGLPEDARSHGEFQVLKSKGLLHSGTVIIHGTAFGDAEFGEIAAAHGYLVWSPQSNLALYGRTTDVKTALARGVPVSLGVDWNPTGSDNIFAELRVADTVNREQFGGAIPSGDWLKMITERPAEALALSEHIGKLAANHKADITVVHRLDGDVNRSLLQNRVQDVELVIVGGRVLYGADSAVEALRPGACEALTVHGSHKKVCVKDSQPHIDKSSETLAQIQQLLRAKYSGLAPLAP